MLQACVMSKSLNGQVHCSWFLLGLIGLSFWIPHLNGLASETGAKSSPVHSIDEKLEGPESIYTNYLLNLIRIWPKDSFAGRMGDENPLQLQCIETPDHPYYIG